jgi:O-antigen/teichoic acid export membrane protein
MRTGVVNAGLRVVTLGSRFALSLYLAKFLSIRDVGVFALLTGLIALLPPAAGLGLNYFVSRTAVRQTREDAIRLGRDKLLISLLLAAALAIGCAALAAFGWLELPLAPWLFLAVALLEVVGFDVHLLLLARSKSAFANILLFLRSGLWVFPYMVAAFFEPSLRTIDAIALFWLGGLILCLGLLLARYRDTLGLLFARDAIAAHRSVRPFALKAPKIYLADLGLAGSIYIDRFVVSGLIDVHAAGIYFFYASIINGIYVVALASSVQVYAPQFRMAYTERGVPGLHAAIGPRLKQTLMISVAAFACALPLTWGLVRFTGKPELLANFAILPVVILAYTAKIVSDFMSAVIAAAEQDNHYAIFNIAGLAATSAFCALGILMFGLIGAALGLLVSAGLIGALRLASWRRLRAGPLLREAAA